MIQLRALGVLDLRKSDGAELRQVLAQPKRAALLTYLALATPRGAHPRDKLVAVFWPDQDAEHARNALSQAVHFLRRALGDDILMSHNGDSLAIAETAFWIDTQAFDEAVEAGRLKEAIGLYRGDFLEGFHVANAPEFDRWLEGERARLGARYDLALETLAVQSERARDYAGALNHWRRLAARSPYNSAHAMRLMRAVAATGDTAGAIRYAQVHERLLREELDLSMPAEVAALITELQTRPASPAPKPASAAAPQPNVDLTAAPRAAQPRPRRAAAMAAAALLVFAAGGAAAIAANAGSADAPRIRTIAVLPFDDRSPDTSRLFADGLHDAVTTELARHPELTVRAPLAVERYRGTDKTLLQIADELKVDGIVKASVRRDGNSVRITASLLHGPSNRHLWADGFDGDLSHPLTLQDSVADAIAQQVRIAAFPGRETRNSTQRSAAKDMLLRELVLRGKHVELARTQSEVFKARDAYERAVRLDSTYAPAVAALSNIHTVIARYAFADVHAAHDSARMYALRAVRLDSTLSEARTVLGISYANGFEFVAADREFRAAIRLGPSDAQAHYWYAMFLAAMGRGPESLGEIRRSLDLELFVSRGHYITLNAAEYLATGQRSADKKPAGTRWSEFLSREPGEPWAYRADAYDLAEAGKCDAARTQIAHTAELAPRNLQTFVALAKVEWWCGDKAKARAMLEDVKRHPNRLTHGLYIAMAHATWGDRDSAFAWLDKSEWSFGALMDLRAHRFLDGYRSDPRYAQLLRKLGLPNATYQK